MGRIGEKEMLDPITQREVLENVIQQVGRPRHFGFDGDLSETLVRLDPKKIAEAAGHADDKGESEADRKAKQKAQNDLKRVGDKAEILSEAVEEELAAQAAAAEQPARAYA